MPPGTLHAVLTIRNSVSLGGMCHLPTSYIRMLRTQIQLHLEGLRLTNSDYPGTHTRLFELLGYYYRALEYAGLVEGK